MWKYACYTKKEPTVPSYYHTNQWSTSRESVFLQVSQNTANIWLVLVSMSPQSAIKPIKQVVYSIAGFIAIPIPKHWNGCIQLFSVCISNMLSLFRILTWPRTQMLLRLYRDLPVWFAPWDGIWVIVTRCNLRAFHCYLRGDDYLKCVTSTRSSTGLLMNLYCLKLVPTTSQGMHVISLFCKLRLTLTHSISHFSRML